MVSRTPAYADNAALGRRNYIQPETREIFGWPECAALAKDRAAAVLRLVYQVDGECLAVPMGPVARHTSGRTVDC